MRLTASVVHPHTQGVKCVVRDERGRALFVRHNYGDRTAWELPGGGVTRREAVADAARREAFEELGLDIAGWTEVGTARGDWHAKDEVLTVFSAPWPGGRVRRDPVEIAAVAWFALDDPPERIGPTTNAALDLL